jgi:hypothetical protein
MGHVHSARLDAPSTSPRCLGDGERVRVSANSIVETLPRPLGGTCCHAPLGPARTFLYPPHVTHYAADSRQTRYLLLTTANKGNLLGDLARFYIPFMSRTARSEKRGGTKRRRLYGIVSPLRRYSQALYLSYIPFMSNPSWRKPAYDVNYC